MGGSFGGYVAAKVHENADNIPNIMACIAINGVYDLERDFQSETGSTEDSKIQLGATPEIRVQNSVKNDKKLSTGTPLFLIAGLEDTTCRPEQSYTLYKGLKSSGNTVDLVCFEGEEHSFTRPNLLRSMAYVSEKLSKHTGYPYLAPNPLAKEALSKANKKTYINDEVTWDIVKNKKSTTTSTNEANS